LLRGARRHVLFERPDAHPAGNAHHIDGEGDVAMPGRTQLAGDQASWVRPGIRSEEHTSELQSREKLVCRLLLEKKKTTRRPASPRSRPRASRRTGTRRSGW